MLDKQGHISVPETIFISHASKDEKYVKELVNLLTPLNISNIICSSLYGYHIPNDMDIYDYLEEKLNKEGRVIFLLSKNYYQSPACLNEMGAFWILNKNYTTILTPNFTYEEIAGAINPNQMAFKLNDEDRLAEFIETIKIEFDTQGLPTMRLADLVKQTIQNVEDISYDEKGEMNRVTWNIESCRNKNSNLEVALRIINSTSDRRKLDSIIFNFKDRNQNSLVAVKADLDITLHKNENRVFYFELDYEDSKYNLYRSAKQEIELSTYVDAFLEGN